MKQKKYITQNNAFSFDDKVTQRIKHFRPGL